MEDLRIIFYLEGRWVIEPSIYGSMRDHLGMVEAVPNDLMPGAPDLRELAKQVVARARADYVRFNVMVNGDGPLVETRAFEED